MIKRKEMVPAPNKYTVDNSMGKHGRFYIGKSELPSFITTIEKESKKVPGVGKYE